MFIRNSYACFQEHFRFAGAKVRRLMELANNIRKFILVLLRQGQQPATEQEKGTFRCRNAQTNATFKEQRVNKEKFLIFWGLGA